MVFAVCETHLPKALRPVPYLVATFLFQNVGHVTHDFSIDGKQTPLIQPGQTAKLAVAFTKNGKYPYLCTVPGHAEGGMKGVFTVG